MRLGIPKESLASEARVAIVPDSMMKLSRMGIEVLVEKGAGEASGFSDDAYEAKGAKTADAAKVFECEIVASVNPPAADRLRDGLVLICMADPLGNPSGVQELAKRGVTCLSLELMPRISRAQAMDVLSSMANVAGYKAVLLGAARLPKLFPLMMTAAGTVRPARVFVLGAGVAGLQAIATAQRLGAVTEAYDIRPDTKEQVESLGARFIEFDLGVDGAGEGGYAKELTPEQKAKQAELMAKQIQSADVVITTAQVPGRKAPMLIPGAVVEGMKKGSVIVDMAASTGGNCELSEPDAEVVKHGVTIIGPDNLPGSVSNTTSQLYANNVVSYLAVLVKEGELALDLEDEVIRDPLICHKGEITNDRVKESLA